MVLGNVGLVQIIPPILFTFAAGYAADHFDRRKTAILTQTIVAAVGFLLAGATGDFLFVYAVTFLKIPVTNGYLLQMAAAGTQIIGLLAGGWLGDRIGRQKVNFVTAVLAALVSLPLFRWGIAGGSLGQLALAAALLLLMATVSAAVAYAAFVEITPKRHRAGLVGIGSLAGRVAGGFLPKRNSLIAFKYLESRLDCGDFITNALQLGCFVDDMHRRCHLPAVVQHRRNLQFV